MVTFYDENVTKHHIKCRECNGLPWGFPGQPAPVPVETHTCGCVRVMGLVKPRGSQTHRGLGCPCPRLPYPNFIVIAIITCIYYNKHMLVYKNTRKRKRRNSLMAQMTCIWRRLGFFLSGSYHSVSHSLGNCLYRCLIPAQKINETDTAGKPLTWISFGCLEAIFLIFHCCPGGIFHCLTRAIFFIFLPGVIFYCLFHI